MKRLLLITDAWAPQTNGVVTTLQSVLAELPALGWEAHVLHPGLFRTVSLPSYPEIRVTINPWQMRTMIESYSADAVHIATEGPLGCFARQMLVRMNMPFTTSLHTKFPEYVQTRIGLPLAAGYRFLRWFHAAADKTLCTTITQRRELEAWGMENIVVWDRGVDTRKFKPDSSRKRSSRPRLLYVGRVAPEKNIEAFLALDIEADKIVVGDGPSRATLQSRYPEAQWLGYRYGSELVAEYAAADVLVFPSRTDTFGLVMLEAMACGTPVAAYPVTGPVDVVCNGVSGWLDHDLGLAVTKALTISRVACRAAAEGRSWTAIARRLIDQSSVRSQQPAPTFPHPAL